MCGLCMSQCENKWEERREGTCREKVDKMSAGLCVRDSVYISNTLNIINMVLHTTALPCTVIWTLSCFVNDSQNSDNQHELDESDFFESVKLLNFFLTPHQQISKHSNSHNALHEDTRRPSHTFPFGVMFLLFIWFSFYSPTVFSLRLVFHHSDNPNEWHYRCHHGNSIGPVSIWSSANPGAWQQRRRRLPVVITLPESHQVNTLRRHTFLGGLWELFQDLRNLRNRNRNIFIYTVYKSIPV